MQATALRRRLRLFAAASALASTAILAPAFSSPAQAAPGPSLPTEFQLDRYQDTNPGKFRSYAYADNGMSFLRVGRWMCQFGPGYRYVGCSGKPATAPPTTEGAAISTDIRGPHWVRGDAFGVLGGTNYHFGSRAGFVPPTLAVGSRVTINGVTCTAPRADVVACRTNERGFILTPSWHKFFFPSDDEAHDGNPNPRYLPPRLQYWNQLPATPTAPK